jgi:glutamate 5-kinase
MMNREEINAVNTFNTLFRYGSIPIVNENDTVATEEIEFGDNDTLSAIVAVLIKADLLILLSDIDGLYDKNPKHHPDAQLIPVVRGITSQIEQYQPEYRQQFWNRWNDNQAGCRQDLQQPWYTHGNS